MPQVMLPSGAAACFGQSTVMGTHTLPLNDLFSDSALIDLPDNFPRKNLYALSMGTDPTRNDENKLALHDGVSGAELLQAVQAGRLWLNVTRVDQSQPRFRDLITALYVQLCSQASRFKPDLSQGTLLISSPSAQVYYHADGPASVLWHIRGRKRIWVYPPLDEHYMKQELLEDIFAGVRHEYLPYVNSFDAGAQVFDLEPGQFLAWPQNAPHRVVNLDGLNVSLSTEHFTAQSRRRARVYVANRFLRTRLGQAGLSTCETGVGAMAKMVLRRLALQLGLDPLLLKHHQPSLRVDAHAPLGVSPLNIHCQATC